MKEKRWCIVFPNQEDRAKSTFVAHPVTGEGLAFTKDLAEARLVAGPNGLVVDVDWFSSHWGEWVTTGVAPEEALPPKE